MQTKGRHRTQSELPLDVESDQMFTYRVTTDQCVNGYSVCGERKSLFLSESELLGLDSSPPHKKNEYLLGRYAVKQAINHCLWHTQNIAIKLNQIELLPRKLLAPQLNIVHNEEEIRDVAHKVAFSLSHSDVVAVAAAKWRSHNEQIGIDIEYVRTFSPLFLKSFLTPNEQQHLAHYPHTEQPLWATTYWSIKEACLKALGVGLRIRPSRLEVTGLTNNDLRFCLDGYVLNAHGYYTHTTGARHVSCHVVLQCGNS